jgi:hypothetical protein
MIKVHRRWWLPAILGGVVLLVAGIGLSFAAPASAGRHAVCYSDSRPTPSTSPSTTPSSTETGLQWSDWEDLGGSYTSGPAVASWGVHRLDVSLRPPDRQCSTRRTTASSGIQQMILDLPLSVARERWHGARSAGRLRSRYR